tara:strand:+ start:546 stop:746 length:201 start_codon:yes stop_codon:yes gene_type:complete
MNLDQLENLHIKLKKENAQDLLERKTTINDVRESQISDNIQFQIRVYNVIKQRRQNLEFLKSLASR